MSFNKMKNWGLTPLSIGVSLQLMLTMTVIFVCIQLLFSVSLHFPVGLLLGLASPLFFVHNQRLGRCNYLFALMCFLICCAVCGQLYDFSYDGQTYHQLAQIMLVDDGWNPFWGKESIGQYYPNDLWVNAYPKGMWLYAASFYGITGNILAGKSYQLILMLSTFMLVYEVLHERLLSISLCVACSFAIVLNPVVIAQCLSYYIDGALYLLIIDFLCLSHFAQRGNLWNSFTLALFGTIVLACNTKFTGLAYMVILCATNLTRTLLTKKKDLFRYHFAVYTISGISAVCFFGFNPYMTNIIRHENVGWPITGAGHKIDIISRQINSKFAEHSRLYKFAVGYNAWCSNSQTDYPKMKFPGETNIQELKTYGEDTRIGGFGALFGVILLTSTIMLCALVLKKRLTKDQLLLLGGLLCSVFVNPECWWARYVPQLWLFCILVFIYSLRTFSMNTRRYICLCYGLLLTANVGISTVEQMRAYVSRSLRQYEFNQILAKAQRVSKAPAYVNFGVYYSKTASILEHDGIDYVYYHPDKMILPQGYNLFFKDEETVIYIK